MEPENKAKILECALQLFAAHGYEGVGIQRIVGAARVTKPTLYHYFGNKQGLLAALLTQYYSQLDRAVEQAAVYEGDLPATLNTIATAYFRFANLHPVFYRMQLAMWFAPTDSEPFKLVASLKQRQQTLIREVFMQGSGQHEAMTERHRIHGATFLGMIHTYIGMALNGHITLDESVATRAVHQFLHGIFL